jgi:ATP-binding cassette subfamily C protein CydD
MRPLDPRLLRYASAARWFLAAGSVIGLLQTLAAVAFAWLLSQSIVLAIAGRPLGELAGTVGALAAVVVTRALLLWVQEVLAQRGAATVKSQLRTRLMVALVEGGPDWFAGRQAARLTTVATSGLDALDNYFARYLPQLLLTVIATPIVVLVMLAQDLPSGITVILALPLIPVFMVLVGWATRTAQQRQWETLQLLGTRFLDIVGGLGTLKIFGREGRQAVRLRQVTEDYRSHTMSVLRISFLSGFVLELAASLSVALVAVSIGIRLVDGQLAFATGLFVLLLAPEAYLPLRQVGAQFHAAADGVAAAEEVFTILDDAGPRQAQGLIDAGSAPPAARPTGGELRLESVSVRRGTDAAAPGLERVDASWWPGELIAVAGPSGVGKSTLLAALAGFVAFSGRITLCGTEVAPGSPRDWLAWAGQKPGLLAGTVAENVALGEASVDQRILDRALALSGAAGLDPSTLLGVNGVGLSGGQAQRVAVARAFYRALAHNCPVVALDEPSSALDAEAESALVDGLRSLAGEGRTVVVASHRPAVLAAADRVLRLAEQENRSEANQEPADVPA